MPQRHNGISGIRCFIKFAWNLWVRSGYVDIANEMEWLSICISHFKLILNSVNCYFDTNFTHVQQDIIWTNDDLLYWCIYVSLNLNDFTNWPMYNTDDSLNKRYIQMHFSMNHLNPSVNCDISICLRYFHRYWKALHNDFVPKSVPNTACFDSFNFHVEKLHYCPLPCKRVCIVNHNHWFSNSGHPNTQMYLRDISFEVLHFTWMIRAILSVILNWI